MVSHKDIDGMRAFCLDYAKRELEYRRLSYLGEMGYSESDLIAYKAGKKYPLRARRVFERALRMRAVRLTPAMLMSRGKRGTEAELSNPARRKMRDAVASLIPSTVCMVFTVSVILTAKEDMTLSTVIDGIVKLSALPVIGFKGMMDGFRFAREDKACWLETKARLLESYIEGR